MAVFHVSKSVMRESLTREKKLTAEHKNQCYDCWKIFSIEKWAYLQVYICTNVFVR